MIVFAKVRRVPVTRACNGFLYRMPELSVIGLLVIRLCFHDIAR